MIGMRLIVGIVVSACACEIMGAISKLVNVKAVKGRNIGWCIEGQMEKFRNKDNSLIGGIIKPDDSGNVRVG